MALTLTWCRKSARAVLINSVSETDCVLFSCLYCFAILHQPEDLPLKKTQVMPWCLGSVPQLSQCFACVTACCKLGKLYGMPALHPYSSPPWPACHIALCFPLLQQVQGWGGGWPLNRKRFRRNVVQHVQHFWVASGYPSSFPSPFPIFLSNILLSVQKA